MLNVTNYLCLMTGNKQVRGKLKSLKTREIRGTRKSTRCSTRTDPFPGTTVTQHPLQYAMRGLTFEFFNVGSAPWWIRQSATSLRPKRQATINGVQSVCLHAPHARTCRTQIGRRANDQIAKFSFRLKELRVNITRTVEFYYTESCTVGVGMGHGSGE